MLYEKKPSILTEYIVNNYKIIQKSITYIPHEYNYISDPDLCYDLIIYVINSCNLAYDDILTQNLLYGMTTDNNCIKILELLLNNYLGNRQTIAYKFLLEIMMYYSLDNFEYFMDKYFHYDREVLINILAAVPKLDCVQYLVEIIGRNKISCNFFRRYNDYDCIKWLCDQQLLLRPNFDVIADGNVVVMIVQNLINNLDYDYIKISTRIIMQIMIGSDMLDQLMKIVPINIFDMEIVFEIVTLSEYFSVMDLLIVENYKPACFDDVVHDLELLKKVTVLEYINKNF